MPEIKWMILGEKVADGALLYHEVLDSTGPLSAFFYGLADFIFGRSSAAFSTLAVILFLFQCGYFNYFLLRLKAYNENVYVPALIYALLGFMAFDTVSLSPQLMGTTFLLFSIRSVFAHLEARFKNDINIINAGMYTGVASLFYLPFIAFIPAMVLSLIFYSSTIRRRYFLLIYSIAFPFIILWGFYYWKGHTESLSISFFQSLLRFDYQHMLNFGTLITLIAIPAIILVLAILKTLQTPSYINYQSRLQGIMLLYLFFAIGGWLLWSEKSGASLIAFIPMAAFFITHYFLLFRRRLWQEIYFTLFALLILMSFYGNRFEKFGVHRLTNFDRILVDQQNNPYPEIAGHKILVLGNDLNPLLHASLATPYLSWQLSSMQFKRLDYYDNLSNIYLNFQNDPPVYIIDQESVLPEVFERIPSLGEQYQATGKTGLYKKISSP
ncbi:MAG: hypothetical protein ACFCUU_16695 [Cyclobacteriaceae bacterium]